MAETAGESEVASKEITFKTITQEVFKLTLPLSTTVAELKAKIFEDKGDNFEVERQKLIYNGKVLEDTQQLSDVNVDEKKYIVVMVSRKKVEQPVAAQTSNVETAKASTPTQPTESGSTSATAPTATPAVPSTPEISPEHEAKISNIMAMGYPREEVIRALRAAFWDGDRAVEYLCTGIPAGTDAIVDADEGSADALLEQELVDEEDPLAFLRDSPQFAQICQLARSQPDMLPQILGQIATANPELMQIIRENQEAFLQMLNEANELQGEEAQQGLQDAGQAGHMTIAITEADRDAIRRLQSMGFPEQLVIEAYFACDKNEDLAVNYILSRMDEVSQDNN